MSKRTSGYALSKISRREFKNRFALYNASVVDEDGRMTKLSELCVNTRKCVSETLWATNLFDDFLGRGVDFFPFRDVAFEIVNVVYTSIEGAVL